MGLDHDLTGRVRALDEHDLRRLVILAGGLLQARTGRSITIETAGAPPTDAAPAYRQQMVRCGKKSCTRCPHGPYWYAFWREGGRTRSRYVGKTRPEEPGPND